VPIQQLPAAARAAVLLEFSIHPNCAAAAAAGAQVVPRPASQHPNKKRAIGNEYVEQPVVIVVEKARAPAPENGIVSVAIPAPKLTSEKGRVAFIPVERVVIVGKNRDVEIDLPSTVVIADCDSMAACSAIVVSKQIPKDS